MENQNNIQEKRLEVLRKIVDPERALAKIEAQDAGGGNWAIGIAIRINFVVPK